jgi:hypothetical protein
MELFGPHGRTRTWLRFRKFKLLTSIGRTLGNDVIENALTSRRDLAEYLADLQSAVPQGQVIDTTVTAVAHREWREHFAGRLQGRGLELGPLHRPIPRHDGMRMTYVDYQDQATLQNAYPKLAKHIVPVDVLDDAQTLAAVEPASFDFLISAHVIEHMRDPIGALVNWLRAPRRRLLYRRPDKRRTFKLRVRTTSSTWCSTTSNRGSATRALPRLRAVRHHAMTDRAIAGRPGCATPTSASASRLSSAGRCAGRWIDGHVRQSRSSKRLGRPSTSSTSCCGRRSAMTHVRSPRRAAGPALGGAAVQAQARLPARTGRSSRRAHPTGITTAATARDLKVKWTFRPATRSSPRRRSPAASPRRLAEGELLALDLATGKPRWRYKTVGGIGGRRRRFDRARARLRR